MMTSEHVKLDVVQVNIEIAAIDRLVQYYFNKIEQWETHLGPEAEGLVFLQERYDHLNNELAQRLKLKQDAGLSL